MRPNIPKFRFFFFIFFPRFLDNQTIRVSIAQCWFSDHENGSQREKRDRSTELTMAAMSKWKLGRIRRIANSDAAGPSETLAGRRAEVYHCRFIARVFGPKEPAK